MGLFDFLTKKHASAPSPTGATDTTAAPAPELKKEMERLGFDMSNVKIDVDGGIVTLSGTAKSTSEAEKIALAIGNTRGVKQIRNDIAATQAEPESQVYVVQTGDTLWRIAEHFYGKGHGDKYTQIFEANRPMLSDPDKIYPGQSLRVPHGPGEAGVASAGAAQWKPPAEIAEAEAKKGDATQWKSPTT